MHFTPTVSPCQNITSSSHQEPTQREQTSCMKPNSVENNKIIQLHLCIYACVYTRSHLHTLAGSYHLVFVLKSRLFCSLLNTVDPEEER